MRIQHSSQNHVHSNDDQLCVVSDPIGLSMSDVIDDISARTTSIVLGLRTQPLNPQLFFSSLPFAIPKRNGHEHQDALALAAARGGPRSILEKRERCGRSRMGNDTKYIYTYNTRDPSYYYYRAASAISRCCSSKSAGEITPASREAWRSLRLLGSAWAFA